MSCCRSTPIGWKPQNIFFDAADTLIGSPEVGEALGSENPFQTSAFIKNSDVDIAGSIALSADNTAEISATTGSEAKQEWKNGFGVSAKYGAQGMAAGVILASNKVSAGASAYIDNSGTGAQAGRGRRLHRPSIRRMRQGSRPTSPWCRPRCRKTRSTR